MQYTKASNATMSACVDTFTARLDCEPAHLELSNVSEYTPYAPLFHSGAMFTFNMISSRCTVPSIRINSAPLLDQNIPINISQDLYWGSGQVVDCIQDGGHSLFLAAGSYHADVVWTGNSKYDPPYLALSYDQMFKMSDWTSLFCTPTHRIVRARVDKEIQLGSPQMLKSINLHNRYQVSQTKP